MATAKKRRQANGGVLPISAQMHKVSGNTNLSLPTARKKLSSKRLCF